MKTPPNIAEDQFLEGLTLASDSRNVASGCSCDIHILSCNREVERPDVEEEHGSRQADCNNVNR